LNENRIKIKKKNIYHKMKKKTFFILNQKVRWEELEIQFFCLPNFSENKKNGKNLLVFFLNFTLWKNQ